MVMVTMARTARMAMSLVRFIPDSTTVAHPINSVVDLTI